MAINGKNPIDFVPNRLTVTGVHGYMRCKRGKNLMLQSIDQSIVIQLCQETSF